MSQSVGAVKTQLDFLTRNRFNLRSSACTQSGKTALDLAKQKRNLRIVQLIIKMVRDFDFKILVCASYTRNSSVGLYRDECEMKMFGFTEAYPQDPQMKQLQAHAQEVKKLRIHLQTRGEEVKRLRKQIRTQNQTIGKLRSHLQLYDADYFPLAPGNKVVLLPPQYPSDYSVAYPALLANLDQLRIELAGMRQDVAKTRQTASAQRQILRKTNAKLLQCEKQLAAKEADESNLLARKHHLDQAVTKAQESISAATSVDAVLNAAATPAMLTTVLVVQISALRRLKAIATAKSTTISLSDFTAAASFAKGVKKRFGTR